MCIRYADQRLFPAQATWLGAIGVIVVLLTSCGRSTDGPPQWNGTSAIDTPPGVYFVRDPDWSADDSRIAFAGNEIINGSSGSVFVVEPSTLSVSSYNPVRENRFPKWGLVSDRILFGQDDFELQSISSDHISPLNVRGYAATWSPNEEQVAVFWDSTPRQPVLEISVHDLMDNSDKTLLSIATSLSSFGGLDWSVTSNLILASLGYASPVPEDWTRRIYVLDPTSGNSHILTGTTDESYSPSWGPDGNWFVYLEDSANTHLVTIVFARADGTCELKSKAARELSAVNWSNDGERLLLVFQGSLFVVDIQKALGYDPHDLDALCGP